MRWRKIVFAVCTLIILVLVNLQIMEKERVLKEGELVLLELAPVDPRSLMQGDYMRLRYAAVRDIPDREEERKGFVILTLDENRVATFVRTQTHRDGLQEGELAVRFFYNSRGPSIGAESYFFEEGTASYFEEAEYGALRIDSRGESVLVGLHNEAFELIVPPEEEG